MGLTVKRENFCYEYCVDGNGTQAAIRAGYAPDYADRQAHQMLNDLEVQIFIAEIQAGTRRRLQFGRDEIMRELQRIASFDPAKLYDADGRLKAIHELDDDTRAAIEGVKPGKYGREYKVVNKMAAIDKLMKKHNMFEDHEKNQQMVVTFQGKFTDV